LGSLPDSVFVLFFRVLQPQIIDSFGFCTSLDMSTSEPPRTTVFVTHATPDDNEFALWLSSKLAMAGYRVWVDRRRLRGGADFWDEVDRVLRNEAIKQVVVFTEHIGKPGVKKELAIGDIVRKKLADSRFMIPVRNSSISYSDAPPEFLRDHIVNAHPNWHDCLKELFETLEADGIAKNPSPDTDALRKIVEAREDGRRFTVERPEMALTNWFPIGAPENIRYYRFDGLQEQMRVWLDECHIPVVPMGRLAGSFADPAAFAEASSFAMGTPTAYDIPFADFVSGDNLGPYRDKSSATNDVTNLLRQHFNQLARKRGLVPVEFANKDVGWFFPDDLLPANKIVCEMADGRRLRRSMSGKFKDLRWHVCLVAKPRVWPELVYRIHVNVVLSADGKAAIPGEKTHKRRRRLTRSWWNDVWRDRMLAAMHHLADGAASVVVGAGNNTFNIATMPLLADVPISYDAVDAPLPSEEDDEGNVVPVAALDDQSDDMDEGDGGDGSDGEDES
jgi:TIR domain